MINREIIWRGKTKIDPKWIYGDLVQCTDGRRGIIPMDSRDGRWIQVDPETLGQFIWRYDKYKNRLFEGDILVTENITNDQYDMWTVSENGCTMVIFDTQNLCFSFSHWEMEDDTECSIYAEQFCNIVGNIHDDPHYKHFIK